MLNRIRGAPVRIAKESAVKPVVESNMKVAIPGSMNLVDNDISVGVKIRSTLS